MQCIEGKTYDVVVAGAGSAGFTAAVQAGRAGLRVALVEKYGMPGGTLTVMGNNSIDQFNNPHRPVGARMVIRGIGWAFAVALAEQGFAVIPDMDAPYERHWQYGVRVNPIAAAKLMDDMLLDAGVDLYYNQGAVAVEMSGDAGEQRMDAVVIATKAGLKRLPAAMFIDCTGDGDLCAWAGAPFELGDTLQPGTMRLYLDGDAQDEAGIARANALWAGWLAQGKVEKDDLQSASFATLLHARGDNINHVSHFNAADSDSKTAAEIQARASMLHVMEAARQADAKVDVVGCAPEVSSRESRRILGDVVMRREEYLAKHVYPDAIAYTYWFVDIHRPNELAEIIYLRDTLTPTLSLGAMRPLGLSNVYVAGRCVSSDRGANSAIRVKASCMAMGQACGAAAAVAIRENHARTRGASLEAVRSLLKAHDAIVPE